MATRFACDPEQAQQVTERLVRVGGRIAASPPSMPAQGGVGSGVLEAALTDFDSVVIAAAQRLGEAIDESSKNFAALASGSVDLDQQEAEGI